MINRKAISQSTRLALGAIALALTMLSCPSGIMAAETVYVASIGNGISKTDTDGATLTTLVPISYAWGLAADTAGTLYVSQAAGGLRPILKIDLNGSIPSVSTLINWPFGGSIEHFQSLALDSNDTVYASSGTFSGKVYKIGQDGTVLTTFDLAASNSYGLAFDTTGFLYVATYGNGKIIKVDVNSGAQTTFFQLPAGNFFPHGLAFDSQGNLFVSDPIVGGRILKLNPTGTSYSVVASGLAQPRDLAFDSAGNLLVSANGDGSIQKISPSGSVMTIASGLSSPNGLVIPARRIDVTFSANLGSFCGFQASTLNGRYTFSERPPFSTSTLQASYKMDSARISIGSEEFIGGSGQIDIASDIPGGSFYRDYYNAFWSLGDANYAGLVLKFAGLTLEADTPTAPNPALTTLNLPTSSADLIGFKNKSQRGFVTFFNPTTGQNCAVSGNVTYTFSTDPPPDNAPVANAGADQSVRAGQTAFLDGSESFDDNTPSPSLSYQWTFASRPVGSVAVLQNPNTATPSFLADVADTYTLQLVVADSSGQRSAPDLVTVSTRNLAPTADAGADRLVLAGSSVYLDGLGSSDPDGDSLTYSWYQSSWPVGSTQSLTAITGATTSFIADVPGAYVVGLTVLDALGSGVPDTVTITAAAPQQYAAVQIVGTNEAVAQLTASEVTTAGNQQAFTNTLTQALAASQQGNTATEIKKLQNAIERTDGCALRGTPDQSGPSRDWITDCAAQAVPYASLRAALDALLTPSN